MIEPIQEVLDTLGTYLYFSSFEIKALPGYGISILSGGESSMYDVQKVNYSFKIATKDAYENGVKSGDVFTIEDGTYIHTFKCTNAPVPDLTGWSELLATWENKLDV